MFCTAIHIYPSLHISWGYITWLSFHSHSTVFNHQFHQFQMLFTWMWTQVMMGYEVTVNVVFHHSICSLMSGMLFNRTWDKQNDSLLCSLCRNVCPTKIVIHMWLSEELGVAFTYITTGTLYVHQALFMVWFLEP